MTELSVGAPKPPETRPAAVWRPVEANLFGKPHKAYLIDTPDSTTYISPSAIAHQIQGSDLKERDSHVVVKGIFVTSTQQESKVKIPHHRGGATRFVVYDLSRVANGGDIRFKVITSPHKAVGSGEDNTYFLAGLEDVPAKYLIPQITIGQPLDWQGDTRTAKTSALNVSTHSLLIVTGDELDQPDSQFPKLTDIDAAFIATNRIPELSKIRDSKNHSPLSAGW